MAVSDKLAKARAQLAAGRKRAAGILGPIAPYAKSGGAGFVAFHAQAYAADQFDFVKTTTYGGPLLLLGAGAMAGKRGYGDIGKGLAGAAGYALAFNMELQKFQDGKRSSSPVPTFKSSGSTSSTQGYDTGEPGMTAPAADPFVEPGPVAVETGWSDDETGAVAEYETGAVAELRGDTGEEDYDVSSALNIGGGVGNEWQF